MVYNQTVLQNKLKASKPAERKNGALKSGNPASTLTDTGKGPDRAFRSRLKVLEEQNIRLENLLKQRTSKLIEVAATNNQFISIIAHDLRSPFTAIIGVLDVLRESLNEFSMIEINKFVNIASNSANRTLSLLDSLLEWTISQKDGKNFNPVKINLVELLEYEIVSFNTSAQQKQISLNYCVLPDLNVSADIQMVKTILRNLIGNAIKFTNAGGEITISAFENNNCVEIEVKDNGIGIPIQAQKDIFKMVAHYTSGTGNEPGCGLGLLLCKEFVDMHNGRIWVESEEGKGSTFKFTLPHYL